MKSLISFLLGAIGGRHLAYGILEPEPSLISLNIGIGHAVSFGMRGHVAAL